MTGRKEARAIANVVITDLVHSQPSPIPMWPPLISSAPDAVRQAGTEHQPSQISSAVITATDLVAVITDVVTATDLVRTLTRTRVVITDVVITDVVIADVVIADVVITDVVITDVVITDVVITDVVITDLVTLIGTRGGRRRRWACPRRTPCSGRCGSSSCRRSRGGVCGGLETRSEAGSFRVMFD
jgi:hypothetical protein